MYVQNLNRTRNPSIEFHFTLVHSEAINLEDTLRDLGRYLKSAILKCGVRGHQIPSDMPPKSVFITAVRIARDVFLHV